jgi:hypothetical protein
MSSSAKMWPFPERCSAINNYNPRIELEQIATLTISSWELAQDQLQR